MASDEIHLKAVLAIAVVFMLLVVVQLWSGREDEGEDRAEEGPQTSAVQITSDGHQVDLSAEALLTLDEARELMDRRIALLTRGKGNERRATAIRLAYMTNDPQEQERLLRFSKDVIAALTQALLVGLNDPDEVVSTSCRDALVGVWRIPSGPAATQHYAQGLAAYEAGRWDRALSAFEGLEKVWGALPPDVYRLRGTISLANSLPDQALQECGHAVSVEPRHFLAHYVLAEAYEQKGDHRKAVEALDAALRVYKGFAEAERLRRDILAKGAVQSL